MSPTRAAAKPSAPIRVLIIATYPIIREGLAAVLRARGGIEIVGQAGDASGALRAWAKLKPDVTLLDGQLEGANAATMMEVIRTHDHRARVIIFSGLKEDQEIVCVLRAGAVGYLDKASTPQEIVACVERVHAGHRHLAPKATEALTISLLCGGLTERERQLITLLGKAKSNREIAHELHIAESTVKGHMRFLLMKLNARNREEAVTVARECGLLSPSATS